MKSRRIAYLTALLGTVCSLADEPRKEKDPSVVDPPIAATIDPSVPGLIPWPMRGEVGKGKIPVGPNARIVAAAPELVPLTKILSQQILKLSGRELPVAEGAPQAGDILLRIQAGMTFDKDPYLKMNPDLKGYEHRITATAKGVLIEGTDYKSTALATATLLQALGGEGAGLHYPPMKIEDKPASTYSGVMLDVARQFHPIEGLRTLVDMCQLYKVPYLHLHLTDDQGFRLPSKAFPQLSTPGSSYSEEEVRDLVAYADARGVTIIPEIEVPGHSGALQGAMPEVFGALNETTGKYDRLGVINIANEEIYPVLEKIVAENIELFKSSPYFHIGGDEANFSEFRAHPTVQKQIAELEAKKITTSDQIFAHFLNRMNAIVKKHGRKTICWEGFDVNKKVDKDIIIFAWHGQSYSPIKLIENGYTIVNVPWTVGDSSLRANYEWNKWYLNLNETGVSHQFPMTPLIIGGSQVLWERAAVEVMSVLRPKTPIRHERLYSPFAGRTYEDYAKRFKHTDNVFERLAFPAAAKFEGLLNTSENLYLNPVKVTLTSPVPGAKLVYTLNGKEVSFTQGTPYTGPFEITAEHSRAAMIPGYAGPRTDLYVRAYDSEGNPLGGSKLYLLRHEAPKFEYVIRDLPPKSSGFPADSTKLPVTSSGILSRLESTLDMGIEGPPRLFEARGYMDVRTPGTYKGEFIFRNANRKARLRVNGGPWQEGPPDRAKQVEFTIDKVGLHLIEFQQLADDGQVGVAFSCQVRPQDPPENKRQIMNDYFSQWFAPLPDKAAKK
jgi:hexosaminidase